MAAMTHQLLVRRLFEDVWNQGNDRVLDELLAPAGGHVACANLRPDNAYIRANLRMLRAAFPDWRVVLEEMISMPDRVLARWSAWGTHQGAFMGLAPTGRRVTASGISIFYIAQGRIQDARVSRDSQSMLQQVYLALTQEAVPMTSGAASFEEQDGDGLAIALGA